MLIDEADGTGGGSDMAVDVECVRRLFTVEEYNRMAEVGILKPTDRVELIRGEIVEMSPPGRRHIAFVNNLNKLLVVRLGDRAIVSVQNPVIVGGDSEPQPDLAVLRPKSYRAWVPVTGDVLLLVEVAETSLRYDRTTKLRLYAEVGIPEYWVVDAAAERVETYRTPTANGYRDVQRVEGASAGVSVHAFPDVVLPLAEIFA
jgi:Uma2 family endonuclease